MKKPKAVSIVLAVFLLAGCELVMDEPTAGALNYIAIGLDYHDNTAGLEELSGPPYDATEIADALEKLASVSERTLGTTVLMVQDENEADGFLGTYPSLANVKAAIEELAEDAGTDDLTIFFYSGHGGTDTGDLYLAPETDEDISLSPEQLFELLGPIDGDTLVIVDACYSGNLVADSASSSSLVYWSTDFYEKYFSDTEYSVPDLFALTASAADTLAYEKVFEEAGHSHGIFSYALLNALSLDSDNLPLAASGGSLSVDDLYEYIIENQDISSNRLFLSHQHPMTSGGAMDLVLFRFP
jgi:uncharacterized caspase-like protein